MPLEPTAPSERPDPSGAIGAVALGALLFVLGVAAPRPRPAPLALRPVDPRSDPWYALMSLEGVGRSLAHRIVAFREMVSPIDPPSVLRRVPGVGNRRLDTWSRFLRDAEHAAIAPRQPAAPGPGRSGPR